MKSGGPNVLRTLRFRTVNARLMGKTMSTQHKLKTIHELRPTDPCKYVKCAEQNFMILRAYAEPSWVAPCDYEQLQGLSNSVVGWWIVPLHQQLCPLGSFM